MPRRARPSSRRRPVDRASTSRRPEFLEQFHAETSPGLPAAAPAAAGPGRDRRGPAPTCTPRPEVAFGARVAWRNAARCIGRLYWHGLHVRDRRAVRTPSAVADECAAHLRECHPRRPDPVHDHGVRARPARPPRARASSTTSWSATPGTARRRGAIRGDARAGGVHRPRARPRLAAARPARPLRRPAAADRGRRRGAGAARAAARTRCWRCRSSHPEFAWFADLRLRWHAVPAISNMPLSIGGITYPAAPFNGWYLGTEIGARNLADADRYDLLPVVADRMGLDPQLGAHAVARPGRDRARAGGAALVRRGGGDDVRPPRPSRERFLKHLAKEERAGRSCPADWSWIVPPVSGGLTPVFHRYYDEPDPARPRASCRRTRSEAEPAPVLWINAAAEQGGDPQDTR